MNTLTDTNQTISPCFSAANNKYALSQHFILCGTEKTLGGQDCIPSWHKRCISLIQTVSCVDPQVVSILGCLSWIQWLLHPSAGLLPGFFQSGRTCSHNRDFSGFKLMQRPWDTDDDGAI